MPLARLREQVRLDAATLVPDLAVSDTAGQVARLSAYRGKWTLVVLWGTWCGPCREEMATVDRLFRDCQASGRPCAVVPIATPPDEAARVAAFRASRQLHFRAFVGGDDLVAALRAPAVPHKLILTPDGRAFALAGDWEREARYWLLAREEATQATSTAGDARRPVGFAPDGRWTIKAAPFDSITLISGIARCGDTAWVSELHRSRVTRLDLLQPAQVGERLVPETDRVLHMPSGLVADCQQQVLHVVELAPMGVASVDARSGRLLGRITAAERDGVDDPILVHPGGVVVGGLSWSAALPPDRKPPQRFFEGVKIGYRIDGGTNALRSWLVPYELSCRAWGACGKASIDAVVGDPRVAFVAALPTSRRVGLYNGAGELVETLDVTSPRFVNDGRSLGPSDARTSMLWGRTNSEIHRVFAFGQVVATIHATNDIPPDWNFQPARFKVLMNLHRLDGTPIALDIPLPDLPIGRDEEHLYVVDYGVTGRNQPNERVVLLSYRISPR